jgi:hypothetical protein
VRRGSRSLKGNKFCRIISKFLHGKSSVDNGMRRGCMEIVDHKKIHHHLYRMKPEITQLVSIPHLSFISAHGSGQKNIYAMHEGDALWSITRTVNRLKDMTKLDMHYKFKLMPLEIEWSAESALMREESKWKALMQVPDLITQDMFQMALHELEKRKRSVRVPLNLEQHPGGTAVQTLHSGPYDEIEEAKERITLFCNQEGYRIKTEFREVYINQPFCNPPEKLKTIVRAGVEKVN